jgi:hypothetical protein
MVFSFRLARVGEQYSLLFLTLFQPHVLQLPHIHCCNAFQKLVPIHLIICELTDPRSGIGSHRRRSHGAAGFEFSRPERRSTHCV